MFSRQPPMSSPIITTEQMKHHMFMNGHFLCLFLSFSGYVIKCLWRSIKKGPTTSSTFCAWQQTNTFIILVFLLWFLSILMSYYIFVCFPLLGQCLESTSVLKTDNDSGSFSNTPQVGWSMLSLQFELKALKRRNVS